MKGLDILRIVTVVVVVVLALEALRLVVYHPYVCNIAKSQIEGDTLEALGVSNPGRAAAIARGNIMLIRRCLECAPTDVDLYVELGANWRILNSYEEAIAAYQQALKFDHRPEIYLNLGLTQLEAGRTEAGMQNLAIATKLNPHLTQQVQFTSFQELLTGHGKAKLETVIALK